jgi:protein-tyrosine phosphatase
MITFIRRAAFALLLTVPFAIAGCGQRAPEPIPITEAAVVGGAPGVYTLAWSAPETVTSVTVYAGTDPLNVGREREVGKGGAAGHLVVSLPVNSHWFFEFVPETGSPLVMGARRLNFESVPNLRDVGGYRTADGRWVKMGRVYRSDQLDKISDEDFERLKDLDFKLICDLRTDDERAEGADRVPPNTEHMIADVTGDGSTGLGAILGDTTDVAGMLSRMPGEEILKTANREFVTSEPARAAYKAVFTRLADPASLPTLIHCTSGKDRTGWGAAALLTLLGVPQDMVMFDYMMSNRSLQQKNRETLAAVPEDLREAMLPLVGVRQEYLQAALDEVQATHGSIEAYFKDGLGLTDENIAALRENFLTP